MGTLGDFYNPAAQPPGAITSPRPLPGGGRDASGRPLPPGAGAGSRMGMIAPPTSLGSGQSQNPYDLGRAFNDYYGGKPTHQLVTEMQGGASPASNAATTVAGPNSSPAAAGTNNAVAPGVYTGNPANGYSPEKEAGGLSNTEQGGPPSSPVQTQPVSPNAPRPREQAASMAAPPPQPAAPIAPPPAPPNLGPQTPSNFTQGGTTPLPPPTIGTFAPPTTPTAPPAAGNPEQQFVMKSASAEQPAPANAAGGGDGDYSLVRNTPAWQELRLDGKTQQQKNEILRNAGYVKGDDGRWTLQPQPAPGGGPGGTSDPGALPGDTSGTPPGETPGGTPPGGTDTTQTPPIGEGANEVAKTVAPQDFAWNQFNGNWVEAINSNPTQALQDPNYWQKVWGLSDAQARDLGNLPKPGSAAQGGYTRGLTLTGLDFPQGVMLYGNEQYIDNPAVQGLFVKTWQSATALNQAMSEGLQDPAKIRSLSEKLNAGVASLAKYGIKYQPWTDGNYGSTTDTFDGIWSEDPDRPSLSTFPSMGGVMTQIGKLFNLGPNATTEQRAAAFEAAKQWIAAQAAMKDKDKAAGQYGQAVDIYANDPSRAQAEAIAKSIGENPDPTDWGQINRSYVANADRGARETADAVGESFARRGLGPVSGAGLTGEMLRRSEGDKAMGLGDLAIRESQSKRQGELQALDALGTTFARYAGGEALARQALGNTIMGAPMNYGNPAAGVGSAAASIRALQLQEEALDAAKDASKPGAYDWAALGVNLIGSVGSMMGGF